MEKIILRIFASLLGCALLVAACVSKESGFQKLSLPPIKVVEYRSETLKEYEMFVIYLANDTPRFVISRIDGAGVKVINVKSKTEEGYSINLIGYTELKLSHLSKEDGIESFDEIELVSRGTEPGALFKVAHTKRKLTIGSTYNYTRADESGALTLTHEGKIANFSIQTKNEDEDCKLSGKMQVKGSIGYFQHKPNNSTCSIIFFFTDTNVETLPVSLSSACDCNYVLLNQQFGIK